MAAFDLLGRRWAMGIIWNLSRGPTTFRSLQDSCETISPSILNARLKDLREAKLVDRTLDGYHLTEIGKDLILLLKPIGDWSIQWAQTITPEDAEYWDRFRKEKGAQSPP
jgi:DNA-binding HxlR family transcriptional regulator